MSLYTLDEQDRKSVEDIFKNLDQLKVVDQFKAKLQEMIDTTCDQLTNYLQDEYVLRFEDIVRSKAKKIVIALLKGEDLSRFGLATDTKWNTGEPTVYDSDEVLQSIMERFSDTIRTADALLLAKENAKLKKDIEWQRSMQR